ncbi:MAG TPA: LysR family transcriptional regulator, partial [Gemmatimonadaceae bacterium]|nr:LysR family transcriptional regulator [Gemmatimonadaceae bacterium]
MAIKHVELRHLRYFVAVAEELHFGRAAQRVGIAQPPLSQQIQQLERLLGARLLNRSRRRVELTQAGRLLLDDARRILADVARATDRARRAELGEVGTLTVAFAA